MSRLIDADELSKVKFHPLPYTHIVPNGENVQSYERGWNDAIDAIVENQPTIDAVSVVRCRDCKHKRMVMKSGCLGCDIQCCLHPYDWYCPDGEKVTE